MFKAFVCGLVTTASLLATGIEQLTLEEEVPMLFMIADYGDEQLYLQERGVAVSIDAQTGEPSPAQEDVTLHDLSEHVDKLVSENRIGGVLFKGMWTPTGLAARIHHLRSIAKGPLIFAQDLEWGLSMRHFGAIELPKALCMGAICDDALLEAWADMLAKTAKEIGITCFLGPVADVNSNPKNPVIHDRSFGDDPAAVAHRVSVVVRALRRHGLLVCLKHFPGHGDTSQDSHTHLAVVKKSSVDLLPFRAGIEAGAECVMTGHICFPNTPSGATPASLSSFWCRDVLRNELVLIPESSHQPDASRPRGSSITKGARIANTAPFVMNESRELSRGLDDGNFRESALGFQGVILTDDLIMAGARGTKTYAQTAVEAVKAGNDLSIVSFDIEKCVEGLIQAVRSGELQKADLDEHARRVHKLQSAPLFKEPPSPVSAQVNLHNLLYKSALTLVGEPFQFTPSSMTVLQVGDVGVCPLLRDLVQIYPSSRVESWRRRPRLDEVEGVLALPKTELLVVLCDLERAPSRSFGMTDELLAGLQRLVDSGVKVRYVVFGSPYALALLPKPITSALVAYDRTPGSERAVLEALSGAFEPNGVLPVRL